jgi:hypothetical protein
LIVGWALLVDSEDLVEQLVIAALGRRRRTSFPASESARITHGSERQVPLRMRHPQIVPSRRLVGVG